MSFHAETYIEVTVCHFMLKYISRLGYVVSCWNINWGQDTSYILDYDIWFIYSSQNISSNAALWNIFRKKKALFIFVHVFVQFLIFTWFLVWVRRVADFKDLNSKDDTSGKNWCSCTRIQCMFGRWWSITQCSETTWNVFNMSGM